MIQDLKQKISHFRSELLMGRYAQAYQEGHIVIEIVQKIMTYGIQIDNLSIILNDIKEEVKMAQKLLAIIQIQKPTKQKQKNQKKPVSRGKPLPNTKGKSTAKSVGKSANKNERVLSQNKRNPKIKQKAGQKQNEQKIVSKWGNKKESPTKKKTQTFKQQKKQEFGHHSQDIGDKDNNDQNDEETIPLETDEIKILEQQVILPLKFAQFFKKKDPHRLVVVYYSKCTDLLQRIAEELVGNFIPIELQDLNQWTGTDSQTGSDKVKIYIAPFPQGSEDIIKAILQSCKSVIVLYSGNNRCIYTQSLKNIQKPTYKLQF